MNNTAHRLQLFEAILDLIERKREETGDASLGLSIERAILETQMGDLEREILENPGAFEPWLVRSRRAEA
jgi:hypothetical protein